MTEAPPTPTQSTSTSVGSKSSFSQVRIFPFINVIFFPVKDLNFIIVTPFFRHIMLRFLIVAAATVAMAAASTQHRHPNSNHRQFQERQGFG